MGSDTTKNAEYTLDKHRFFNKSAISEMREIVEVSNVIAFEFKPGPVFFTDGENFLDFHEGISENQVPCSFEVLFFPVMLEFLEAGEHRIKAEINGSHIQ